MTGLSLFFSRMITIPVMELKIGSEALGRGDLDYHVDVKTGDEFEDLAISFNKMALDLKEHLHGLIQDADSSQHCQQSYGFRGDKAGKPAGYARTRRLPCS